LILVLLNHDININIAGAKTTAKAVSLENRIIAEYNINQSIFDKFVLESSKGGVSRDRNNTHIHIFTYSHIHIDTYIYTYIHVFTLLLQQI
jgi:hypothetical protein